MAPDRRSEAPEDRERQAAKRENCCGFSYVRASSLSCTPEASFSAIPEYNPAPDKLQRVPNGQAVFVETRASLGEAAFQFVE